MALGVKQPEIEGKRIPDLLKKLEPRRFLADDGDPPQAAGQEDPPGVHRRNAGLPQQRRRGRDLGGPRRAPEHDRPPDRAPIAGSGKLSPEQAYVLSSVAVDLRISNLVDVPNFIVTAILPLDVFTGERDDDDHGGRRRADPSPGPRAETHTLRLFVSLGGSRQVNRRDVLVRSLGASAFLLMGHTPYRQWPAYRRIRLIFVASEADEVSLRLGASVAETLAVRLPQSNAMMATTATTVDVVSLLTSAQLDVALLTSDDAYEAVRGTGKFKGRAVPLRALAVCGSSVLHLVTLADHGIIGVPDLKGKVLASGPAGSPTETLTFRVLEAYGIDPGKDVRQRPLAGERAAAALKDKQVGAIARADLVASGAVRDLASTPGLAFALLEHGDALPKIEALYGPIYRLGTIPKDTYPGVGTDVGAVAVAHLLVCREDFPDDKAYQIAKTLAESPGPQPFLPFHPGAVRFYDGEQSR